jgi:hypothetical protein
MVLLLPLLAAACGGEKGSLGPGATVPHAASTSTTSSDPYAIPSPITAAYVQRVLDALEAINPQMGAIVVTQRNLSPEAARLLRSTSTADDFATQTQILLAQLAKGLPGYLNPPGAVRDTIENLVYASNSCIFVAANRDYSALLSPPPALHLYYFVLRRAQPQDDPTHVNPTGWVEAFLGHNSDNSQPEDTCVTHP